MPLIAVDYDESTHRVLVIREKEVVRVPGEYSTRDSAKRAGDEYCSLRGWNDKRIFTCHSHCKH